MKLPSFLLGARQDSHSFIQIPPAAQIPIAPLSYEPLDHFGFVYWGCVILGVAVLLPWNAFITISDYYRLRFLGSFFSDNFNNYFTFGFTLINILALLYALSNQTSAKLPLRIRTSLLTTSLVFLLCLISVRIDIEPNLYFYMTFTLVLITGFCTALGSNGLFGIASQLPPSYIQAVCIGNAVAGVVVSAGQILTIWLASTNLNDDSSQPGISKFPPSFPSAPISTQSTSAFYYFLSTFVFLCASLLVLLLIMRNPFYRFFVSSSVGGGHSGSFVTSSSEGSSLLESHGSAYGSEFNSPGSNLLTVNSDSLTSSPESLKMPISESPSLRSTFKSIFWYILSSVLSFTITLSLFPAITSSILPFREAINGGNNSNLNDSLFVPIHFLIFNIGDWCGRSLAGVSFLQIRQGKLLFLAVLCRLSFYPLLLSCNVMASNQVGMERLFPLLFTSDQVYWVLLAFFAISHGWLCSLTMISAPQCCDGESKALAGTLLVSFISIGMTLGSFLSFGIRAILCGCNPF